MVSDPISWQDFAGTAIQCNGRIDALINNAAIMLYKPLQDMTLEEYRSVIDEDIDLEQMVGSTPLGRIDRPDEIAGMAVILISGDSSSCTGAEFVADGGMLA